jgi:hydrogenase maturation factor
MAEQAVVGFAVHQINQLTAKDSVEYLQTAFHLTI